MPRWLRYALVYLLVVTFAVAFVSFGVWAYLQVRREAGSVVALIVVMSIVSCVLAGLHSLRWLRSSRVLITSALTISGTFLTLVLGYQLEHPAASSADARLTAWVLVATVIAFGASVISELRTQHLEAAEQKARAVQDAEKDAARRHEEAEREYRAVQRHVELMNELARLRDHASDPPRTAAGLAVDRIAAELRTATGLRRRPPARSRAS